MLAQEVPQYNVKQDPLSDLWTQLFVFGRSLTFFSFAVNSKVVTTDNSISPQNHLFLIMLLLWQLTLLVLEKKKQRTSSQDKEVCF